MLYGDYPFFGVSIPELVKNVKKKVQNFTFPDQPVVSNESKDLIRALLQPDPDKRISFSDFFKHKIFLKIGSTYGIRKTDTITDDIKAFGQALKGMFDIDSEF